MLNLYLLVCMVVFLVVLVLAIVTALTLAPAGNRSQIPRALVSLALLLALVWFLHVLRDSLSLASGG